MDKLRIKGGWDQMKGVLKQKYAQLTDDDFMYEEGKEDEMIGKIESKTGMTEDEIKAMLFETEYQE